jgi:TonB family protein
MKTRFLSPCWLVPLILGVSVHAAQTNPQPVETPSPGYPAALTDSGVSGSATVDILVKADGSVDQASLKSADHEAFGEAALAAIKKWRFTPATVDGTPVEKRVTVPFKFAAPVAQQLNARYKRKVFQEVPERVLSQKEFGKKLKPKKPLRAVYPPAAKGAEANVQVKFVVAPDGSTINPEIQGKPPKEFLLPAINAIANAAYEPPVKDGKGVYVEMSTKLAFAPPPRGGRGGGGGGGDFGGGGGFSGGGGGGGTPDE